MQELFYNENWNTVASGKLEIYLLLQLQSAVVNQCRNLSINVLAGTLKHRIACIFKLFNLINSNLKIKS